MSELEHLHAYSLIHSPNCTESLEQEAGSDHLICIFGLLAFVHGICLHLCYVSLLLIVVVKSCPLCRGHGQLVLAGDFALHAPVLKPVLAHLLGTSVFATLACTLVHLLPHADQC